MLKKTGVIAASLLLCAALLGSACAGPQAALEETQTPQATQTPAPAQTYTFQDALGHEVTVAYGPERVVALMGSYAETWLLAGGKLVGTTEDAISERDLELDADTKVIGQVKTPDVEKVLELDPDFVILSPDIEGHMKLDELLGKAGVPHAYFKVEEFEEYLDMLKICTELTGREDLYVQNGTAIAEQIDAVKMQAALSSYRPSVLFVRALSTKAKAKARNNFVCTMLDELGCDNIAARHDSLLEDLSMEEIITEDPDFIFVVTMGEEQAALDALKAGIQSNPAWNNLSAVKNGKYIVLDKDLFHYKPNARWGESYETLAKYVYPQLFQ